LIIFEYKGKGAEGLPNISAINKKIKSIENLTETIINLETVNPIEFFGVNNGKLDLLKKKFPLLKILSRGTQIKLSGAPEQIETAKEKIDLILQYLERNGHLSENYFEQILGGDDAEVIDNFVDRNPNDILVFGPNGKTVRARTANQKKMVQAGDRNDILFAIGPAGTGKTYTAVAMAVRAFKKQGSKENNSYAPGSRSRRKSWIFARRS